MQASVPMVIAFAKAAEQDTLDHVSWTEKGLTFSACLKEENQCNFTYDLYEETLLVGTFQVHTTDNVIDYDAFLNLPFTFASIPIYTNCPTCGAASPLVTQSIVGGLRKRKWHCKVCGFQFLAASRNWEDDVNV